MQQPLDITKAELKDGGLFLTVPVWQAVRWLKEFQPGRYDLLIHREKRSNDANRYCWALCRDIAEAIRDGSSDEDVYRDAIKAVGIAKDFPSMSPDNAETLMAAWRRLGIGWQAEVVDWEPDGEHQIVRCWYGSSVYNTKQMARLIDRLTQDAQAVGADTLDQQSVAALLEDWEEKHAKK